MVFLLEDKIFMKKTTFPIYADKIFILNKPVTLTKLEDYSLLFTQILNFVNNTNYNNLIKSRLNKLLTIGSNIKYLDTESLTKKESLENMKKGLNKLYNKPKPTDVIELRPKKITIEEAATSYMMPVKELSIYLHNDKDNHSRIFFPECMFEEHKNKIVTVVENITGDYNSDLILSMLRVFDNFDFTFDSPTIIKNYSVSISKYKINCSHLILKILKTIMDLSMFMSYSLEKQNSWVEFNEEQFLDKIELIEKQLKYSMWVMKNKKELKKELPLFF